MNEPEGKKTTIRRYLVPATSRNGHGTEIFNKTIFFQNLQESAESLIEMYNYNENLLLKDVPYVNLNRMQDLSEEVNTQTTLLWYLRVRLEGRAPLKSSPVRGSTRVGSLAHGYKMFVVVIYKCLSLASLSSLV